METLVSYRLDDSIARITMDDGKVNVLSPTMLDQLDAALDRAETDGAVVVLSGRRGSSPPGSTCRCCAAAGTGPRPCCDPASSWPCAFWRFPVRW